MKLKASILDISLLKPTFGPVFPLSLTNIADGHREKKKSDLSLLFYS